MPAWLRQGGCNSVFYLRLKNRFFLLNYGHFKDFRGYSSRKKSIRQTQFGVVGFSVDIILLVLQDTDILYLSWIIKSTAIWALQKSALSVCYLFFIYHFAQFSHCKGDFSRVIGNCWQGISSGWPNRKCRLTHRTLLFHRFRFLIGEPARSLRRVPFVSAQSCIYHQTCRGNLNPAKVSSRWQLPNGESSYWSFCFKRAEWVILALQTSCRWLAGSPENTCRFAPVGLRQTTTPNLNGDRGNAGYTTRKNRFTNTGN